MDWFLFDSELRHERAKLKEPTFELISYANVGILTSFFLSIQLRCRIKYYMQQVPLLQE